SVPDSGNAAVGYAPLPAGAGASVGSPAGSGAPAAAPSSPEVAVGAGAGTPSPRHRSGHLPAPLAATALATGLTIAGADWLARRRTVGVVGGLRAAAGLGAAVGRPARSRRSLVAAGVAAVTVAGLALAPSRVPLASRGATAPRCRPGCRPTTARPAPPTEPGAPARGRDRPPGRRRSAVQRARR